MAHTVSSIDRATRRKCRQIVTLARRFERGAVVAAECGRPSDAIHARRDARSLRCAATMLRCHAREA